MQLVLCIGTFLVATAHAHFSCMEIDRTATRHYLTPPDRQPRDEPTYADFSINLRAGAGLTAHPAALASFRTAAQLWGELLKPTPLHTPVVVDADMDDLPVNVIGSTNAVHLVGSQCGDDAVLPEPLSMLSNLTFPNCSSIRYRTPAAAPFKGLMLYSKAALKALGAAGLDEQYGASDGQITFSTRFAFDYNLTDGLDPHRTDFLSVALHEIGHLLGFISGVDDIDMGADEYVPAPLDLFRFDGNTPVDFLYDARLANPGVPNHVFKARGPAARLSCGFLTGDRNQASHWGADEQYGTYIGIMDPTLSAGASLFHTRADADAFHAMGFQINPRPRPFIARVFPRHAIPNASLVLYLHLFFGPVRDAVCDFGNATAPVMSFNAAKGTAVCRMPGFGVASVSLKIGGYPTSNIIKLAV